MKGSGKGFVELRAVTRGGSELLSVRVIGASPHGAPAYISVLYQCEQQWQFGSRIEDSEDDDGEGEAQECARSAHLEYRYLFDGKFIASGWS